MKGLLRAMTMPTRIAATVTERARRTVNIRFVAMAFATSALATGATISAPRAAERGIGNTTILAKDPETGKVINTAVAHYDINVDCVRKGGMSHWNDQFPIYKFTCTMETEGTGEEGTAGPSTFIWTFKKVGKHHLELVSVGNSKTGTYPYKHSYYLLTNVPRIDPNK